MNIASMALRQFSFENKAFWRNPAAAFFTFVFPLMFMFIFNVLPVGPSQFYVPAMAAFSVITACYTNIAMNVTFARDEGALKRLRGTPLPGWVFLIAKVIHSTFLAIILVTIVTVAGTLLFGVDVPTDTFGSFAISVLVGAAAFSALGLAITAAVPNPDAAPAVVQATILPLLFISGYFLDTRGAPDWLNTLADLFPPAHFVDAMQSAFNPDAFVWESVDLVIVGLWGIGGLLLATRFFSWEPRR
ncbi:MAG TPA: ABC transporter permease [Actinomycetota bacterium]|nr:ABC transporter permease [Actinomycetota bacterium]